MRLELSQHRSVQFLAQRPPLQQVLVKQPGKSLVVMALQQMCQLMHKDVFQTKPCPLASGGVHHPPLLP